MSNVLVVDNSKWFASLVAGKVGLELGLSVKTVQTYSDAERLLNVENTRFFAALVGLYLQDAYDGEIVNLVLSKNIPVIVFTGQYSEGIREEILSRRVIDYVLKENIHSLDHIVSIFRRIMKNESIKILVADDSKIVRKHICDLLETHRYQVFEAEDGGRAGNILEKHPDIKMVITDYNMPNMDGFNLLKIIRERFQKDELAVIGISGECCNKLSARFLKNGANDFMIKPFLAEEFYCRITQNIEMIERFQTIRELTNKDELTGVFGRNYFFNIGERLFSFAKSADRGLVAAVIALDRLKKVNEAHGFGAGDEALVKMAKILKERFRQSDIIARICGNQFCVLAADMDEEHILGFFEDIREKIEKTPILASDHEKFHVTASIGVYGRMAASLDEILLKAQKLLSKAQNEGGNLVAHSSWMIV